MTREEQILRLELDIDTLDADADKWRQRRTAGCSLIAEEYRSKADTLRAKLARLEAEQAAS